MLTAMAICFACLEFFFAFRLTIHFRIQRTTNRNNITSETISMISQMGTDSEKLLELALIIPRFIVSADFPFPCSGPSPFDAALLHMSRPRLKTEYGVSAWLYFSVREQS